MDSNKKNPYFDSSESEFSDENDENTNVSKDYKDQEKAKVSSSSTAKNNDTALDDTRSFTEDKNENEIFSNTR